MSTRRNRVVARVGLLLLAIILFAGGLLFAWRLAFGPLVDVWRSKDWPLVSARIETVQLVAGLEGRQLEVRYHYHFAGRTYYSERYGSYRWLADSAALEEAYAELLYAKNARAWVNPRDPGEALLNRDISWPVALMAIPACGMIFLGATLLWAALASAREFLREKKPGNRG
ncbi:MAG: DUF3592 domain-containing protein [Betaproteobacteria bacterium]|nr:DUF3592 domain-containing protein [Betaproteobacteria bacterium]